MDAEYVSVRFMDNDSRRWDGKVSDVPSKTVVRTGRCNEEGMEEAEVHWPVKGKGKGDVKIWHCVLLPQAGRTGEEDIGPKPVRRRPLDQQEGIGPKPVKRPLDQQEDIGPKPAKKHHTTAGKQQLLRRIATCKELAS